MNNVLTKNALRAMSSILIAVASSMENDEDLLESPMVVMQGDVTLELKPAMHGNWDLFLSNATYKDYLLKTGNSVATVLTWMNLQVQNKALFKSIAE